MSRRRDEDALRFSGDVPQRMSRAQARGYLGETASLLEDNPDGGGTTAHRRRSLRSVGQPLGREIGALACAALLCPAAMTGTTNGALLRVMSAGRTPQRAIHTPIVLVHGYAGSPSNWLPLERRLRDAGFLHVHSPFYNALVTDVPNLADRLLQDCLAAMWQSSSDRVHVIGHSLGGILLRYAAVFLGLGAHLQTAVAIAAPHAGSALARLGRGSIAASLRPGSRLLTSLQAAPSPGRASWVCYWSNSDLVVRPASARLVQPGLRVVNVAVPGEGHLSLLRSPDLLMDVVDRLLSAEDSQPSAGSPVESCRAPGLPATPAVA